MKPVDRATGARPAWGWLGAVQSLLCVLVSTVAVQRGAAADPDRTVPGGPGYRAKTVTFDAAHAPGFKLLPAATTGIRFTNTLGTELSLTNTPVNNGSGLALGDVDGDGWCDIYFCRIDGPNVLYRNLGGWRFEDVTESAGVACPGQHSTGATFADVDGDGDLDLLVNSLGGGTRLFVNDGRGHFVERIDAGLDRHSAGMSMALADIDGDGDLDLYVSNYRTSTILDQPQTRFGFSVAGGKPVLTKVNGVPVSDPGMAGRFQLNAAGMPREVGEPGALYLNDGKGRFLRAPFSDRFSDEEGKPMEEPRDWGLSVMFRDIDGDGAPDIYVCNDTDSPDRIWINDGHGRFRALGTKSVRHVSLSSMGVDFADINRDGRDDFLVVDMMPRRHSDRLTFMEHERAPIPVPGQFMDRPQYGANTLFLARADGTYAEVAALMGVQATDWSWNPQFVDVDLDGYEDLIIANGFHRNVLDSDAAARVNAEKKARRLSPMQELQLRKLYPAWPGSNPCFRNTGGGGFEEMGRGWGFDGSGVSQGMAMGDLDNDGDLDVVMNNLNGEASVLRNEGGGARVAVRLRGAGGNTQGIGARIKVRGGPVEQTQEMIAGGRYLSGAEALRVFAAGRGTNLEVEVKWRGGRRSVVRVKANQVCEIDERDAVAVAVETAKAPEAAVFEDASAKIGHVHPEEGYEELQRQPLLPRSLGQMGPGVAWCDLNGDGKEDLVVGSGKGGRLRVLAGNGQGGFGGVNDPAWGAVAADDQTSVVAWSAEPGSG
ncbi:MAG: CRTAC1 family protein, partial [Verrucomicrobia bacterium]